MFDPDPSTAPLLAEEEMTVVGRILPASNTTLLVDIGDVRAVYKPVAGERPLWDFPDGTLAGREVAAYLVSEALAWEVVPPTVLRDGPGGPGMVQLYVEPDPTSQPVDLVPEGALTPGYRQVLSAIDGEGRPVDLVHEDCAVLRRMVVFDAVINNGDRKGGHVIAVEGGHRYGVDHGVSMSVEPKLRTVLWGWAGEELLPDERAALDGLALELGDPASRLVTDLEQHVTAAEIRACRRRCEALLRAGTLPLPSGDWPAIPWPAF